MVYFDKINPSCASFALPHIRNYFEIRAGCANNMHPFVYDEELKWAYRAIYFVYLPIVSSCNQSRSGVNMRAHLLRKNSSRNFSSI